MLYRLALVAYTLDGDECLENGASILTGPGSLREALG